MKEQSKLYPLPEDREDDIRARTVDVVQLWEALHRAGFALPEMRPDSLSSDVVAKIYQFLAQTPSRLLMVQLEDLLGEFRHSQFAGSFRVFLSIMAYETFSGAYFVVTRSC